MFRPDKYRNEITMHHSTHPYLRLLFALTLLTSLAATTGAQGLEGLDVLKRGDSKGRNWAILVGVNYSSRQGELESEPENARALPELKNAANDALNLADVLTKYYQYEEQNVIVLADRPSTAESKLPTKLNIDQALQVVRRQATKDDTFLFFFAGHGLKYENASTGGNNVAILALDVELKQGKPRGNTFDLPFGLVDELDFIQADKKLIVLDCCYSGEIFNQQRGRISFQPTSTSGNRNDEKLQSMPTFQALASCRASELASDGSGGNSRFTTALLQGLRRIPAQYENQNVNVHQLLDYVDTFLGEDQRPDCRNLIDMEGEFCFLPDKDADFSRFLMPEREEAYLRSMVVSRQGSWWFNEMPWFIPSVRAEMIEVYDQHRVVRRGNELADLLDHGNLRKAADAVFNRGKHRTSPIEKLRHDHARMLFEADSAKKLKDALDQIEFDFDCVISANKDNINQTDEAPKRANTPTYDGITPSLPVMPSSQDLKAVDFHLLAVVKHSLGKPDAETFYKQALEKYEGKDKSESHRSSSNDSDDKKDVVNYSEKILNAICLVDYGELLQGPLNKNKLAADQYRSARKEISLLEATGDQQDYTMFFEVFCLCREADAWLNINRWKQANELLDKAKLIADGDEKNKSPVAGHFLAAHVYRRDAWSKMIQWHIKEAICSFNISNQILTHQFRLEQQRSSIDSDELDANENTLNSFAIDKSSACDPDEPFDDTLFKQSRDYASKVAYLHNLHGIAMARRFEGDSIAASKDYRQLVDDVETAFTQFRSESADADIELQFIQRCINTQERLGDCNLFGNPASRDLREAVDDYRRAMMRVHLTAETDRDRSAAVLLYKQALALSLPSQITDFGMANEMCLRADKVYEIEKVGAGGLFDSLGSLATPVVQACQAAASNSVESSEAQERLRESILAYRDKIGTTPHRDQLEMCLFASKVLLENSGERSHYQLLADADLLLSFCRLALQPYGANTTEDQFGNATVSDSVRYLRPYFDTAMRAKMKLGDSFVKELIQIQAEATRGELDVKDAEIRPVLSLYSFEDEVFLLVDIPNGTSKCISLAENYYNVDRIKEACEPGKQLALPKEIAAQLENWSKRNSDESNSITADCRWVDPVRGFHSVVRKSRKEIDRETDEIKIVYEVAKTDAKFPFATP